MDLSQTLDLHRRIISELNLRESAIKAQEAAARRALEDALHTIALEKHAIKQCRDLLEQAEMLYQSFAGDIRVSSRPDAAHPAAAPAVATAPPPSPPRPPPPPDVTPPIAQDVAPPVAQVEPAPPLDQQSVQAEVAAAEGSVEAQAFSRVQNLRGELSAETERVGNWWAGMWRRGARSPDEEPSWKEAYPPVEGAERAIWDHHNANRASE